MSTPRSTVRDWLLVGVLLVVAVAALPAWNVVHLQVAARRIPVPPATRVVARDADLSADWMGGPSIAVEMRSALSREEVARFFRAQLVRQGWSPGFDFPASEWPDGHYYAFHGRRQKQLGIMVAPAGDSLRIRASYTTRSN